MWAVCLSLLAGVYTLQLIHVAWLAESLLAAGITSIVLLARGSFKIVVAFWLGLASFWLAVAAVANDRLRPEYAGDSLLTTVRIVDFPSSREGSVAFVAAPIDDARLPERIRLTWYEPPVRLRLGDIWQLELRLRRPRGRFNPGAFDFEAWLTRQRIAAVGYVVPGARNHLRRTERPGPVDRFRMHSVARIETRISDAPSASVLAAITVGERSAISEEQWRQFRATGTSHLMAISGLHVGLAAAGAYVVFAAAIGVSVRRRNARDPALCLSVLTACGYATVSGLGTPAQRAALMFAFAAIAVLARRPQPADALLALTCCLLVVVDPLTTMSPGFRLSFGAVALLCWVTRAGNRVSGTGSRVVPALVGNLRRLSILQFALLFGLLPLTALLFGRFSLAAPAMNLLAVPLFGLVTVPLALAGLILDGSMAPIGDQLLVAAGASLRILLALIGSVAAVPGADVAVADMDGVAWLALLLTSAMVVLPAGWPGRAVSLLAAVAIAVHRPDGPPTRCVDIDVLDVGQGLAVAVRTRRSALLFDTGPAYRDGSSSAATTILPYLEFRGLGWLDTLIVSHADADHAGGTSAIVAAVPVARLLVGERLPGIGAARFCRAGQAWRRDAITFRVLHPPAHTIPSGNPASCVLEIAAGAHRVLLTGDIERAQELELVAAGALRPAVVVVVPHHGSRTSSSTAFVAAVEPSLAIVSAGHNNRWGFPKPDVAHRWEAVGARVLATSRKGAIGLEVCATGGLRSIVEYRDAMRRVWHDRDP